MAPDAGGDDQLHIRFQQEPGRDPPPSQVYNLFGLAPADLISQDNGSEVRTLLGDGLGSVRLEMVGGVVETATTYEPYGQVLVQSGVSGTVYGFTGEQEDSATGLLYLRPRYYSPYIYRMLTPDSIVPNFSNPQSLNLYAYVGGNPTNLTDPSGHDPWWCQDGTCQSDYYGFNFNPRDLTSWLYREMATVESHNVV